MKSPTQAFLTRLQQAGAKGVTYDAKDRTLASVLPIIKELRQEGHQIKQNILAPSKMSVFSKRVQFVLEGDI